MKPKECENGCHYKPGSEFSYYTNCTDGSNCALEYERESGINLLADFARGVQSDRDRYLSALGKLRDLLDDYNDGQPFVASALRLIAIATEPVR